MKTINNFNDIFFDNFLKVLKAKGKVRILTYDLETTGLTYPIEITQLGAVIQEITLKKNTKPKNMKDLFDFAVNDKGNEEETLHYEEIARIDNYYQTTKTIEPDAVLITRIIQNANVNDLEYIKSIQTSKFWKKDMDINSFHKLDQEPMFSTKEWEDINTKYDIDFQVGQNIHKYDYMQVLKDSYGLNIDSSLMFDTMYVSIHEKERKKLQGTNLNAEIKRLEDRLVLRNKKSQTEHIEKTFNIAQLERIAEYKEIREKYHNALYDTLLTQELFFDFIERKYKASKVEVSNKGVNILPSVVINEREYKNNDILYIRTNINGDNILKMGDILAYAGSIYCKEIVIVDKTPSHIYRDQKVIDAFNSNRNPDYLIKVLRGFQLELTLNNGDIKKVDALFSNTDSYRRLLPLIQGMKITEEAIEGLKELELEMNVAEKDHVIFLDSCETPKMISTDDKMNYFYFNKYKNNEVITTLEYEYHKVNYTKDESLNSGKYTSDVFQKQLKTIFSYFEKVDFSFYTKLGLSAFPSLPILYPKAKTEPKNNDEIIQVLRDSLVDDWIERDMDSIIRINNAERVAMGKLEIPESDYRARIEEEIKVLTVLNDPDYVKYYFLVQSWNEFITYGPGRGSAGGSLIAFMKRITDVNPMHYELLFERFLDETRPDYPDIDLDVKDKYFTFLTLNEQYNDLLFSDQDYENNPLYSLYNDKFISKFIKSKKRFFGKIKALAYSTPKTLLGNALRLFLFPYKIQSKMTKEFNEDLSISENMRMFSERDDVLSLYPMEVFEKMESLVKLFTNYGVHAGGVISFPSHPSCITPMDEHETTYFDKSDIERSKMIKMDLLGLSTQVVIDEIKSNVKKHFGDKYIYNNNFSTMLDLKTLHGLENGFTVGTFQVESGGMKKILKSLAPLTIDEIIAAVALFRPGPLGSGAVDDFISSTIEIRRKKYSIKKSDLMEFKKWKKLENYNKVKIREAYIKNIAKAEGDKFNAEKITMNVIENLLTYESYFESDKFTNPLIEYFYNYNENKEPDDDSNIYYDKIIKDNKIINVEDFIEKIKELEYQLKDHELLKMIMEDTNGVIIYQEQIMKLSTNLANYTKAESNGIRKAVAKKIPELMEIHKIKLIDGLTTNEDKVFIFQDMNYKLIQRVNKGLFEFLNLGDNTITEIPGKLTLNNKIESVQDDELVNFINNSLMTNIKFVKEVKITEELATYLWGKIESFGEYAFNKSHSAAYSILTYETQYYKEHYPLIAYTILLKHVSEKHKMGLIREIKARGINIELQKLNENTSSDYIYDFDTNTIYIPLTYVKNFGNDLIYQLIPIMEEYNPSSLEEIILLHGKVSKGIMEKIGTLGIFEDDFCHTTQREWYYLSTLKDSSEKKLVIKDLIYDNAFKIIKKNHKIPKLNTTKHGINDGVDELFHHEDILIALESMDIVYKYLSEKEEGRLAQVDNDGNEIEDLDAYSNYNENHSNIENYKEMEKRVKALRLKLKTRLALAKSPLSETLYNRLIKEIKNRNYLFFKENDYKKTYNAYKLLKKTYASTHAKEMRDLVINNTIAVNLPNELIKLTPSTDPKLNVLERENCYVEQGVDIFDTTFIYEQGDIITYDHQKIHNEDTPLINTIIITEFPIVSDFNKYERKVEYFRENFKKVSPTKQYFNSFLKNVKLEKEANVAYVSLFDNILQKEFVELLDEEKEKLFWEAYREKILPLIKGGIDNIILSTKGPKESLLRRTVENTRTGFGFKPQNGEFARILFKEDGKSYGKNVYFMANIYPYRDLNQDMYDMSVSNLSKAFGKEQEEYRTDKDENYNKMAQLYLDRI